MENHFVTLETICLEPLPQRLCLLILWLCKQKATCSPFFPTLFCTCVYLDIFFAIITESTRYLWIQISFMTRKMFLFQNNFTERDREGFLLASCDNLHNTYFTPAPQVISKWYRLNLSTHLHCFLVKAPLMKRSAAIWWNSDLFWTIHSRCLYTKKKPR